jgi:hypothetical protein
VGGSATGWWSRDTLSRDWLVRIVGADRRLGLRDAVQGALTCTGRGAGGTSHPWGTSGVAARVFSNLT